jgi:bifunctional DNA-binding transcriptional regulator/antitoxin component of YhaV-PrlF toxin-antitoxin module
METIKFETVIDSQGAIHLPEEFRHAYGKHARLVVSLQAQELIRKKGRQPGSAKGILKVLSEDDEHLNDFKEYMP